MAKPNGSTVQDRFWGSVQLGPICPQLGSRCWMWTGTKTPTGYGKFAIASRWAYAHRLSLAWALGEPTGPGFLGGLDVDHVCRVPSCVNPRHLRAVTHKQNCENRRGAPCNSTTGIRGVYWYKRCNRWRVSVKHNGKAVHVGYFTTIAEAEAAAIAKRCELFTHNDLDRSQFP